MKVLGPLRVTEIPQFSAAARGVRSAAVAGALGGLAAGAMVAGKQVVKRYVPI